MFEKTLHNAFFHADVNEHIIISLRQKDNKYYCVIKNSNEKEHSNYNQRESSSKYSSGIGLYIISEIFELEQIEYGIYIKESRLFILQGNYNNQ
ncbi:GHKL domain-containing protein [Brochothrix thermosphacta]|uniref:GHKL domain-containing protein n=1 Tax=Brochothrix thermosphacta TaxID=2756 RepID=UPI0034E462F7